MKENGFSHQNTVDRLCDIVKAIIFRILILQQPHKRMKVTSGFAPSHVNGDRTIDYFQYALLHGLSRVKVFYRTVAVCLYMS